MPEAIKMTLRAPGDQFFYVLKVSSLISVIGLQELTWRVNELNVSKYPPLKTYTLLVVKCLVLILFASYLMRHMKRRLATSH